ncbi:hypothetical protein J5N97_011522 [Dioscorea zingiberensis]|uniref:FAD dependent oxidoreductase domain-containing protein n=1 Tax=Dioscorea zingiberensis TaxID=325984 RepID=A0A9D5HPN2_9LILI|nr:hypothetical protein J5N97_011522 [Dioscorea zingiberensis]
MATSALTSKPQTRFLDHCFNGIPLISRVSTSRSFSYAHSPRLSISASASSSSDLNSYRFEPIKESIVAREMTRRYMTDMISYADTDVVVVGAGSAGLSCAYELSKDPSVSVAIVEQSVSPAAAPGSVASSSPPCSSAKPAHHFPSRRAPNPLRRAGDLRRHQARRALHLHDPQSAPRPAQCQALQCRRGGRI